MQMIVMIGLGGALGAIARHLMTYRVAQFFGSSFPYGTLSVNILGSFIMGLVVPYLAERFQLSPEFRGFLVFGVLGGFTTFSAFSLEVSLLIEKNNLSSAALYSLSSVLLAVGALFVGIWVGKAML